MKAPITSDDLILRPLTDTDAGWIYSLNQDPLWQRFIGDRGVSSLDDALTYISKVQAQIEEWGYGLLAVTDKANGEPLGLCGLIRRPHLDIPDLGFALCEQARGRGVATRAVAAVLHWASQSGQFKRISAFTHAENGRSIQLLTRVGFTSMGKMFTRDMPDQRFFLYQCQN